jgi:hypothetical protein
MGNCLHYSARLIARCDGVTDQQIRVIDPPTRSARAYELLGGRVPCGGGGTITRLAAGEEMRTLPASRGHSTKSWATWWVKRQRKRRN